MGPGSKSDAQAMEGEERGFEETSNPERGNMSKQPLATPTPRVMEFADGGPPELWPTPEEQQDMLLHWRQQKLKSKEREEAENKRGNDRLAKQRKADRLKLEALKLRREEIELQEKAILDALEGNPEPERPRRKRGRGEGEESSDSESRTVDPKPKPNQSSDSEEGGSQIQGRISRMEQAIFGSRKTNHEPVITEKIEQFRPPPGRQFPKMNEFGGKGDPEEHCEKYESLMTGMGHCDIMLCKMFKTYLKGPASLWYRSLRPRSIDSYAQLKRKFLRHYSHLCRREKDTEALIHCRQKPDEELGDYLARFKEEAGMVTNLDKVKAAGFLSAGLDPIKGKKLRSSLYDMPPKSLNDIYLRGEAIRRKMESIGGYRDSRKNDHKESRKGGRSDDRRNRGDIKSRLTDNRPNQGGDRDNTVFTPLNTPISKILHEINGKPGFIRPPPMRTPDHKRSNNKYCDYHQDKGHNTDECFQLKKLIEGMIKDGQLTHFVEDLRNKLDQKGKRKAEEHQGEGSKRYRGEVR